MCSSDLIFRTQKNKRIAAGMYRSLLQHTASLPVYHSPYISNIPEYRIMYMAAKELARKLYMHPMIGSSSSSSRRSKRFRHHGGSWFTCIYHMI